ncbi:MAG: class C sortase [Lachnospiraceae bacterium]|nr:class C sortase [Lachnospiraceae bacterium]
MGRKRKGNGLPGSWFMAATAIILFLAGLALMLYPLVANIYNTKEQQNRISSYVTQSTQLVETGEADYSSEWDKANAYNEALPDGAVTVGLSIGGTSVSTSAEETDTAVENTNISAEEADISTEDTNTALEETDTAAEEKDTAAEVANTSAENTDTAEDTEALYAGESDPPAYEDCLNLTGNGVMGYLYIPKIEVQLPIYHTTNDDVLKQGVGHLEGTSLPVGGESTHAVLAAHRGLPGSSLFTDLDRLEVGDHFLLYILDEILCYEVDQILVTEPDDTEAVAVTEGEDLVTLLTCTPYAVNSHRLLVRGHRVEYSEETAEVVKAETGTAGMSVYTSYGLWTGGGLCITGLAIAVLYLNERKKRKKAE